MVMFVVRLLSTENILITILQCPSRKPNLGNMYIRIMWHVMLYMVCCNLTVSLKLEIWELILINH